MFALRALEISLIVWLTALAQGIAGAGSLPAPTGPVVLTVTGRIANTNADKTAEFDMAMLEGLPSRTTKVSTPWAEGVNAFQGPLTRAVLEAVGLRDGLAEQARHERESKHEHAENFGRPHAQRPHGERCRGKDENEIREHVSRYRSVQRDHQCLARLALLGERVPVERRQR